MQGLHACLWLRVCFVRHTTPSGPCVKGTADPTGQRERESNTARPVDPPAAAAAGGGLSCCLSSSAHLLQRTWRWRCEVSVALQPHSPHLSSNGRWRTARADESVRRGVCSSLSVGCVGWGSVALTSHERTDESTATVPGHSRSLFRRSSSASRDNNQLVRNYLLGQSQWSFIRVSCTLNMLMWRYINEER